MIFIVPADEVTPQAIERLENRIIFIGAFMGVVALSQAVWIVAIGYYFWNCLAG